MSNKEFCLPPYTVEEVMFQLYAEYVDWGTKLIKADKMWEKYMGEDKKVAVLDTGACLRHPDLRENIRASANFTGEGTTEDGHGHGSFCSSIVGASKNGAGMIGTAPKVQLYVGKVLTDSGSGGFFPIIDGIRWAYNNDVNVISMSLGLPGQLEDVDPEILKLFKMCREKGIIVCVAAGNMGHDTRWGETINMLARSEDVLAIGAIDKNEEIAKFSSRGDALDYAMPGVNVYGCYKDNKYATMSGTSMATPYAAGAIALIMQRLEAETGNKPTFEDIRRFLDNHAKDVGIEGKDDLSGMGLVHLDTVFEKAPAPPTSFWRVQLGAFGVQQNAINFRNKLRSEGISAIIKKVEPYWKVQVGAFSVEENAYNYCKYIKGLGYDAFVVHY